MILLHKPGYDAGMETARAIAGGARRGWLAAGFNWKMAAWSAVVRGGMFLLTNLRTGHAAALRATLAEGVYALLAIGVLGAVTERIRDARPEWLTAVLVWVAMPVLMMMGEFEVHTALHTPQMRAGLMASFAMTAVGSGFSWFAMRRGAFLVGESGLREPSFADDLRRMPVLVWEFVSAGPKMLI